MIGRHLFAQVAAFSCDLVELLPSAPCDLPGRQLLFFAEPLIERVSLNSDGVVAGSNVGEWMVFPVEEPVDRGRIHRQCFGDLGRCQCGPDGVSAHGGTFISILLSLLRNVFTPAVSDVLDLAASVGALPPQCRMLLRVCTFEPVAGV